MEEGEITLTENGLAKLVAKLRKQQLNMGDPSLKWTPDRLAGRIINPYPLLPFCCFWFVHLFYSTSD